MRFVARLGLGLALVVAVVAALASDFTIRDFQTRLDLQPTGEVRVTERLTVVFEAPRRGIIRRIPTAYDTGKGFSRPMRLDQVEVGDGQGGAWDIDVERSSREVSIRIGDPDVFLDPGRPYVYEIRYRARNVINWFDGKDWEPFAELYWNATGDEWDVTIEQASVEVAFPASAGGKGLRARVFAGAYGDDTASEVPYGAAAAADPATATTSRLEEATLTVRRTEPLPPRHGLTVVLNVPADLVQRPSAAQVFWDTVMANLGFGIPLVILAILWPAYLKFGRDPFTVPLQVRFEPPEGMTASECGTLLDENVDQRDISAGFFTLAVKGYLRFHPQTEGTLFQRRTTTLEVLPKADGDGLSLFEHQLLGLLRSAARDGFVDTSDLRADVAPSITNLRGHLYTSLIQRGYFKTSPENVRIGWGCGMMVLAIGLAIFAAITHPFGSPMPGIVGGVVGIVIAGIFAPKMPRRTLRGAQVKEEVKAFEEFIRRGKHRTEWLAEKHPDAAMFEAYLPHAVAFGLLREWAKLFEGLEQATPSWYVTNQPGFNYIWFANDLDAVSNSVAQAASTPPRSDGAGGGGSGFSSGGGFSGGGFGGGGGSSW